MGLALGWPSPRGGEEDYPLGHELRPSPAANPDHVGWVIGSSLHVGLDEVGLGESIF